jgi:hypothetical protein
VGRIGKNKTLVSVSIPNEWREEIDRRATALSMSRAAYVTMILEQWWAKDCPAISEPDRLMQINAKPQRALVKVAAESQPPPREARERFPALANTNKCS